jgi:uncharacterized protein (DUF362 family)
MSEEKGTISRRRLIAYGLATGAGLVGLRALSNWEAPLRLKKYVDNNLSDKLSIVHGQAPSDEQEPETVKKMTRTAVDALGGMDKLVKSGHNVVIKPNMAWNRPPKMAANTNPWVVAALVEMCLEAGADSVQVLDHTISKDPVPCYDMSGIADAAAEAGADVVYVDQSRFVNLEIKDGFVLKKWPFYETFINQDLCDVLINVPVLKDHGTTRLSIGMKNVLGMVGGTRGDLHTKIHRKIPDLNRIIKADLTVMDAYRVLRKHGPTGGRPEDVDNSLDGARRVVASTDPVAVDSYGVHMFDYDPDEVGFVKHADEAGLGNADWKAPGVSEKSI